MKLAWILVAGLAGSAAADSQVDIAAKANQAGVDLMLKMKYGDAAEKFKDAFSRDPQPKYVFNLCTAEYQLGRFGEALTACDAVLNLAPTAELQAKADKLIKKVKDEAAAQHIDVVPVAATPAASPHQEGVDLMLAGKYADAVPKFKDSIARDFFNLCTAEYQLGQFRDALDACKAVATMKPAAELQTKTDKLMTNIRADAKSEKLKIE